MMASSISRFIHTPSDSTQILAEKPNIFGTLTHQYSIDVLVKLGPEKKPEFLVPKAKKCYPNLIWTHLLLPEPITT